jgi:hypothetical protein
VRGELWWQEPFDSAQGRPQALAAVRTGDLLDIWGEQLQTRALNVRLGETVTDIQKTDKFRVVTDKGSYVCDRVILCIGKLIYLLKLDVGAEAEPKVLYEPPDPTQVRDRDVLVVGSSNEALEAAAALAASNRVTLAYPSADLKDAQKEAVEALAAARVNHLPSTRIQKVERDVVVLETPQAPALRVKNDVVFAMLGVDKTELPVGFFRKIHIAYERDWDWKRYALFLASILAVGAFYLLKKFMPGVVMLTAPEWLGLPGNEWDLGSLYPLIYTVIVAAFGVRAILRWKRLRWRVLEGYGGQQTLRLASLIFFQAVFFFLVPLFIVEGLAGVGVVLSLAAGVQPGDAAALPGERVLVVVEPGAGVRRCAGGGLLPRQEVLHLGVRLWRVGGDAGRLVAALLAERGGKHEEGAADLFCHRLRRGGDGARGGGA